MNGYYNANLSLKKSSLGQNGELCPKLPKCSSPTPKIDIDNKARFRYLDSYWFRLFDASICCAVADADTQLTFFDSSAPEKQLLIFRILKTIAAGDYYLLSMAVDKELRGNGIGTTLIDSIEARARIGGSNRISLDVSAKNDEARRLYEYRGMNIESQWPKRIPVSGMTFYRMTKMI